MPSWSAEVREDTPKEVVGIAAGSSGVNRHDFSTSLLLVLGELGQDHKMRKELISR